MDRNGYIIVFLNSGGSKEIRRYEDIAKFREATGASSVMIARAAEWNTSIFRKEGKLPLFDVVREYLKIVSGRWYSYSNGHI